MDVTLPWLNCGTRAMPPGTGSMAEISAKVSASSSIAKPPTTQAMSEAGPACWAASKGANSQPEPNTPLTAMKVRPMKPISRGILPMLRSRLVSMADSPQDWCARCYLPDG